jgi:hypothetical protein
LLLGSLAVVAAACARPTPRQQSTPAGLSPEFDVWNQEARGVLSDANETLRTFDVFQAFRVSTAVESSRRLPSELAWDPPISAAWDEATHVTRGIRGRTEQLFQAVTTARISPDLWREQRALADATHDLIDLAGVLAAYRDRVDDLPPGDAGAAVSLLDKAWSQFDAAAARWGIERAEPISCTSTH